MPVVESRFEPTPPQLHFLKLKKCRGCGESKPRMRFSKHKLGRDGLRPRCKDCCAEENARWRARSSEKIRERNAEYRRENRERHLAYNRSWNAANRDRCDAATARWRERNPEKVWAQKHRHRVLKRNAPGAEYATTEKVVARIEFYGGRCRYCSARADTIDHRIPLARGGSALPANLVPACRSCNSRKRIKTEREWREVMPGAPVR